LRRAGLEGRQSNDHKAGINTRIGRLLPGKTGIDQSLAHRDGFAGNGRIGPDIQVHLDLAIVGGFGVVFGIRELMGALQPRAEEKVRHAVGRKVDSIESGNGVVSGGMRTRFQPSETGLTFAGRIVARDVYAERAVGIGQIPYLRREVVIPFFVAVVRLVDGGTEVHIHRAGHGFDVGLQIQGKVELDVIRRSLREAQAGDQGESEENG